MGQWANDELRMTNYECSLRALRFLASFAFPGRGKKTISNVIINQCVNGRLI